MIDIHFVETIQKIDVFLMAMLIMWVNVFVIFATGAYKKSLANTILVSTIAISITLFRYGFICWALFVLITGSIASTLRSMSHYINDSMIRGKKIC